MCKHYTKSFTSIYKMLCGDLLQAVAIDQQSKQLVAVVMAHLFGLYTVCNLKHKILHEVEQDEIQLTVLHTTSGNNTLPCNDITRKHLNWKHITLVYDQSFCSKTHRFLSRYSTLPTHQIQTAISILNWSCYKTLRTIKIIP